MKVDVILPIHNGEKYVEKAICSILSQSYEDWRLIVIDDVSTDNSIEIVKSYTNVYPNKIRLICLEKNLRAAGARMVGINNSDGELIAFIDQDDVWKENKLEEQVKHLKKHPNIDVLYTDIDYIDLNGTNLDHLAVKDNKRRYLEFNKSLNGSIALSLFNTNSIRILTAVIKRKVFENFGGFDTELFGGEEWEFWVRVAASGCKISYLPIITASRREHTSNVTKTYHNNRSLGLIEAYHKVIQQFPQFVRVKSTRKNDVYARAILSNIYIGDLKKSKKLVQQYFETGVSKLSPKMIIVFIAAYSGLLGKFSLILYRHIKNR